MIKEPDIKINGKELVTNIKDNLLLSKKYLIEIYKKIDDQIEMNISVWKDFFIENWETLVPDLPFSEELLDEKLHKYLERKKLKAYKKAKRSFRLHKIAVLFRNLIKKPVFFLSLFTIISVLITFPLFIYIAMLPANWALLFGISGITINAILEIILIIKTFKNKNGGKYG